MHSRLEDSLEARDFVLTGIVMKTVPPRPTYYKPAHALFDFWLFHKLNVNLKSSRFENI